MSPSLGVRWRHYNQKTKIDEVRTVYIASPNLTLTGVAVDVMTRIVNSEAGEVTCRDRCK